MNQRMIWCAFALVGITVLISSQAVSSDKEDPAAKGQPTPEEMAVMMAKWQKAATPGEPHKHLDYFVGTWKTESKIWMGGPGSPPTVSAGISKIKWVLNGRFLLDHHKGQFMGQEHEGMGLTGYDNYKNMYVASWADNMSTHLLTMAGARDPSGKKYTYYGKMDEPMLDIQGRMVKYVTTIVNDKHYVFEIYDLHARDDYKVIEITYERQ